MKQIKSKLRLLALAAVGLVSIAPSQASLVTTQGDLLLSFYTVNGASVGANSYTINLGAGLSYFNGSIANGAIVNIGDDLVTAFGANWWENSQLTMNLIGGYSGTAPANGDGARTIYAGKALTTYAPGTSEPAKANGSSNHRTWATNVSGFTDQQNGRDANGATASNAAIMATGSIANEVTDYNPPVVSTYFGIGVNPSTTFGVGDIGSGKEAALDLWRAAYASTLPEPTYVRTFSIDSSGNVGVVPEPSTMALLGLGSLAGGILLRRRMKK